MHTAPTTPTKDPTHGQSMPSPDRVPHSAEMLARKKKEKAEEAEAGDNDVMFQVRVALS